MLLARHHVLTESEYLYREVSASHKSEFWQGSMLPMAGGSPAHNELCEQVGMLLGIALRGKACRPLSSDQRLRTPAGLNTYPDVSVYCGPVEIAPGSTDTATNPTVLVEVLSPSTRDYDRGDKLALYKEIPTLQGVLLVEVDSAHIEHVYRTAHGWEHRIHHGRDARLSLVGVPVVLRLEEVYERRPV